MKSVLLFYNPGSGDGEHSEAELREQIIASGFSCTLIDHKKDLSGVLADADIFAIAGGDGTVRKFVLQLLDNPLKYLRPIGLLPFGTANNISKTLKIRQEEDSLNLIRQWQKDQRKPFDIGTAVSAYSEHFFTESMGYGVFPKLMKKMSAVPESAIRTPEEEFDKAFRLLYRIVARYKAREAVLVLDGKTYKDKYLMIEVMNIQNLGSNMYIAPTAKPGDGWLNVALVPESGRSLLLSYIEKVRTHIKTPFPFKTIRAMEASIKWTGRAAHVDDEVIVLQKQERFKIRLLNQLLHFLA